MSREFHLLRQTRVNLGEGLMANWGYTTTWQFILSAGWPPMIRHVAHLPRPPKIPFPLPLQALLDKETALQGKVQAFLALQDREQAVQRGEDAVGHGRNQGMQSEGKVQRSRGHQV